MLRWPVDPNAGEHKDTDANCAAPFFTDFFTGGDGGQAARPLTPALAKALDDATNKLKARWKEVKWA